MLTALAVVAGSVSWFIPLAKIAENDAPLSGSSSAAYFAYGNGSPTTEQNQGDRPFGITVPRHLYNLAWLQYLGYFNKESENGKQYYFELADNIDMTGWTLPPIGTEDNPFIGNFNGNGYVVKGLTISNEFGDYERHPAAVNSNSFEQPHILGFLGVVGDYNNEYGDSAYSSAANEFSNTGLTGLTIKTYLKDSLIGIAAGYVDANMKNIGVDASTITLDSSITQTTTSYGGFTNNISDFSLVGYTTNEKRVRKVDETIYDVNISANNEFNATEQGDGAQGWGGSINMRTIYQRLYGIKRYAASAETLTHRTNYYYYGDVERTSERTTRTNNRMYFYHGYNTSNHTYLGNYVNLNRSGTNIDRYMYLSGGHYESHNYRTDNTHTGYKITDGTNYLTYDGTGLGNTTTAANGTVWSFVQYSGNVYYIRLNYQSPDINRYLYNNNGSLAIGTGTSTATSARWTVVQNGNSLTITSVSDSTKKICYYGGSWILSDGTASYYVVQSGSNYISKNSNTGSTVTNTTTANDAAHFYVDSNNNVYFKKTNDNNNYYLVTYYRNNGSLRVNTSTTGDYIYAFTYSNSTLSAKYNNYYSFYVRYNNGWTVSTSNYSIGLTQKSETITVNPLSNTLRSDPLTVTGPDFYQTSQNIEDTTAASHMYYSYSDTTYFPINVKSDGGTFNNANSVTSAINSGNFDPKETNTGYITAGSDYSSYDTNITDDNYDDARNDISKVRISEYPISNISKSFQTSYNTLEKFVDSGIYTINSSGQKRTMAQEYNEDTYPRYVESKKSFYTNALTTAFNQNSNTYTVASNVYGLHFMDATINMNSIVNGRNVSILGNKADNYQMPVNAVDFNLKQKGVVNFFAGTYFTNNNSFFSLHEIFRNDDAVPKAAENEYTSFNTISDIKEIEEIYTTDVGTTTTKYANIYKYKGKTGNEMYSVPYRVDVEQNKYVMNMNNTDENNAAYVYATMGQNDFNTYKTTYGYQLRFKTSQIGVNSGSISADSSIFYYEFPMNQGEYCLGSVSGGTGAYLLYLDIGANASKYQRTIVTEHFTYDEIVTAYPGGVALITIDNDEIKKDTPYLDLEVDINYLDSACVQIKGGYTNSFTIDRNAGDVTLSRSNQSNAPPVYKGEEITLLHDSGSSSNLSVVPISHDTKDVKRLTYYDVSVNLLTLTKTIITDTSVNGGTATRTIVQENYSSTDSSATATSTYVYNSTTDQRDSMKIYNTSNGVRYTNAEIIDQSVITITPSTSQLLVVKILQNGGNGFEEVALVEVSLDDDNDNGTYYKIDDYLITITPDGADVVIKVVSYSSGKVIYYGATQVTGANQTITITA